MLQLRRQFAVFLTFCGVLLAAGTAHAWIETRVKSDQATVTLDRDGKATVQHRLLLRVRGGPLRKYVLEGVDEDAAPLPDATVIRARSGQAAGPPLLVTAVKTDDGLQLNVEYKKGLRSGTYLFEFSYESDFAGRSLIRRAEYGTSLAWVGPRLSDGVDSVMVLFRLPRSETPPRLDPAVEADEHAGVFLSTLRRSAEHDELELVRPHVARGEPVLWRVLASPELSAPATSSTAALEPSTAVRAPRALAPGRNEAIGLGLGASLLALLVWLKHTCVARACASRQVSPRPLVRSSRWLRSLISGALVVVAGAIVLWTDYPLGAAVPVLAAMALGVFLSPRAPRQLRGPGAWREVDLRSVLADRPRSEPSGRLLDAGTVVGFLSFASCIGALSYAALTRFEVSPVRGASIALASVLLFPIFFTGRSAELPVERLQYAVRFFVSLGKKLHRLRCGRLGAIGRFPDASRQPDEIRLKLVPERCYAGVIAIEVALEHFHGLGGPLVHPVVLLRVADGSPAYRAFPRTAVWVRGRDAHERVTVLRPRLPSRAVTVQLVREVLEVLEPRAEKSASRSPASGNVASSFGRSSSPSQAT